MGDESLGENDDISTDYEYWNIPREIEEMSASVEECTPVLFGSEGNQTINLKNHTHMKKVGHTSEFIFDIYWCTWKTNNY